MTPQTCPEVYLLVTPHLVKLTVKPFTDLNGKWFREEVMPMSKGYYDGYY